MVQELASEPARPSAELSVSELKPAPLPEPLRATAGIKPEVAKVTVHYPEGASAEERAKPKRMLIQVLQMHGPDALEDLSSLPQEVRADIEKYLPKAREQLGTVLSILADKNMASAIYAEGMVPSVAKNYAENIPKLKDKKTLETVAVLEGALKTRTSEKTKELLGLIKSRFTNPTQEQQQLINALSFLSDFQSLREQVNTDPLLKTIYEADVKLCPGEDTKLHQENLDYVAKNPLATADDPEVVAMMDKRDAHLVDEIGKSDNRIAITVLGAGHDLKSEVNAWNKAHPTERITLVEVEPAAVGAYMNR